MVVRLGCKAYVINLAVLSSVDNKTSLLEKCFMVENNVDVAHVVAFLTTDGVLNVSAHKMRTKGYKKGHAMVNVMRSPSAINVKDGTDRQEKHQRRRKTMDPEFLECNLLISH
jgi:hypothetical protein